ncbi:alpha/beta hydrolase [Paraflavitalea sp. CAU 1676]|uniref:alpha/beta hydrolase n=1 Tax=Paraflavitalea sp. CAU 1676 TaxID=3032598 RepID=UPI0023DCE5A0|nr:alpha/beta hydrolase [Paraflavitalea sp. CAU 1676]MDF2189723.1 alpha/beta hydrolase [Paraflavitalea sp. CAU 1676]
MKRSLALLSFFAIAHTTMAQTTIPLYEDSIINSKPTTDKESAVIGPNDNKLRISYVTRPTLTVYEAPKEKANGTAVIVCPGGGYSILAASHEGSDVAKKFNEMGVTAIVLKYRLPNDTTMVNKEIGPLQDAQKALMVVRQKAKEWNIDPHKVGIMGFSAGGHLVSTTGTHFQYDYVNDQPYKKVSKKMPLRPDFMILIYPVISFSDSLAHKGSRTKLLGEHPSAEKVTLYSNELQVTKYTPPTFLVHAKDDKTVVVQNSQLFYDALQKNKVPSAIYLYEKGGHGFGMINKTSDVDWMNLLAEWMKKNKWLH